LLSGVACGRRLKRCDGDPWRRKQQTEGADGDRGTMSLETIASSVSPWQMSRSVGAGSAAVAVTCATRLS
jgi:hypothetical protein